MAIYYTDYHDSETLQGDHEFIQDYADECRQIAIKYFKDFPEHTSIKMIVFDFHRNKSTIFEFTTETRITCTAY